jgi:hypothetical protein
MKKTLHLLQRCANIALAEKFKEVAVNDQALHVSAIDQLAQG